MHIVFISDLHLCPSEPNITRCFFDFLEQDATQANALYILGDLFEAWIGDDDPTPLHHEVAARLKQLNQSGIPVYFIHGNRDFMLGNAYAEQAGITLLDEAVVRDICGTPTLIMHGDTLCLQDTGYQAFRKKIRHPLTQWLLRHLPLFIRKKVGTSLRKHSQTQKREKTMEIMDVDTNEVIRVMEKAHVRQLIHGHTHRPMIHQLKIDGNSAKRIVLGDWYKQGSILVCTEEGCELKTRQFSLGE